MIEPGSCHQTAAAETTARPKRNRPIPSRRCSGSSSRAVCPMLRAVAPTAWAIASQTAATPRPSAVNARATGPGPLRTARGAGRRVEALDLLPDLLLEARPVVVDRLRAALVPDLVRELVPVLRDRALELLRPVLFVPVVDVLLLRDPGGEDVRVAMVINVIDGHTCHRDHTERVALGSQRNPGPARSRDAWREITIRPRILSSAA